jgi:flagellar biosynthesis chaperone FliJ
MTTIAERKKIAKLVLTINDERVINKIKSLLTSESKTAREKYIKQYNKEIDEADKRIEKGEFYTGKQANALLAKWQKEVLAGIKKPGKTL